MTALLILRDDISLDYQQTSSTCRRLLTCVKGQLAARLPEFDQLQCSEELPSMHAVSCCMCCSVHLASWVAGSCRAVLCRAVCIVLHVCRAIGVHCAVRRAVNVIIVMLAPESLTLTN